MAMTVPSGWESLNKILHQPVPTTDFERTACWLSADCAVLAKFVTTLCEDPDQGFGTTDYARGVIHAFAVLMSVDPMSDTVCADTIAMAYSIVNRMEGRGEK